MAEKRPIVRAEKHERELTKVRTTCNFCGVGCQLDLNVDPDANEGRGRGAKVTSPRRAKPPTTATCASKAASPTTSSTTKTA
ncbi:MAG: hypothetical protein R3E96_04260 [Planctomycetota bacterium]